MHLKGIVSLRTLNLTDTQITDMGLVHLKGMDKLRTLNLKGTRISNAGLKHIHTLTSLERLFVTGTRITDTGLADLTKILPNCSVTSDQLSGTTSSTPQTDPSEHVDELPAQVGNIDPVAALEKLKAKITRNEQGEVVAVDLMMTPITYAGMIHLKSLDKLQTLKLDWTKITDAGLVHLAGLTNLQSLNLDNTKTTDAGLVHLKRLTNMEHLVFLANEMSRTSRSSARPVRWTPCCQRMTANDRVCGKAYLLKYSQIWGVVLTPVCPSLMSAIASHARFVLPSRAI